MWLVLVHATWTYKQFWYQPPFLVTNSSTINRLKSICHQWRLSCQDSGLLGMILGFPHVFCKLRCKVMKLTRILKIDKKSLLSQDRIVYWFIQSSNILLYKKHKTTEQHALCLSYLNTVPDNYASDKVAFLYPLLMQFR